MERIDTYIEQRGEGYYIASTRVSLDSIVAAYWRGQSPEAILHSYPSLTLAQIYGAIAFYLSNRTQIDAYLQQWRDRTEEQRLEARRAHPELHEKLRAAREDTATRQS